MKKSKLYCRTIFNTPATIKTGDELKTEDSTADPKTKIKNLHDLTIPARCISNITRIDSEEVFRV